MQKYQVIEHFDHCQPPVERIRIVEASGPMEAIRSRPFWKHASRFTSVDGGVSLYTQDRDGVNGCKSTPAISSELGINWSTIAKTRPRFRLLKRKMGLSIGLFVAVAGMSARVEKPRKLARNVVI